MPSTSRLAPAGIGPAVRAARGRTRFAAEAAASGIERGLAIPCPLPSRDTYVLAFLSASPTPIARRVESWAPDAEGAALQRTFGFCETDGSLPAGEAEDADGAIEREVRRQAITVWSPERPDASVGDKIRITGLMAGAVEGSLFLQATGVERVEEEVAHELL